MNSGDQLKLDIVAKVFTGKMKRKMALGILQVSERTLRRYLARYSKTGPLSIKHGNYQKPPANRLNPDLKQRTQQLIFEKYFDFNMSHCLELLAQKEGISIKRETFRKWCHEIGMVKRAKRKRSPKVRRKRDRMEQTGMMLQLDGSPHHWFGNQKSCLIAAIDDATSEIPAAEFFHSEDTLSCMTILQRIVEKLGLFQVLYVDRAGLFGGPKRCNFSQVQRALQELGIHVIYAQSPEAKGRIERAFQTLQDRLIPEMRLRKIYSFPAANHFLQEQFLPNEWQRKFTCLPETQNTAYKPYRGSNLKEIFCLKELRTVKRDHTLSWNGKIYTVSSPLKHSIYKQKIEIRTYQDLTFKAFFAGQEILIEEVKEPLKIAS